MKYQVGFQYITSATLDVEADNKADAEQLAERLLIQHGLEIVDVDIKASSNTLIDWIEPNN